MLEKKIKNDIDMVNRAMAEEGIPSSDHAKEVMRSVIKGCTSFESTFDRIIEAGKKEEKEIFPKSGKKEKIKISQDNLSKAYT